MAGNDAFRSSCSCAGSNPACYKCFGTGFAGAAGSARGAPVGQEGSVQEPKRRPRRKSRAAKNSLPHQYAIRCPICNFPFTDEGLKKHFEHNHLGNPFSKGPITRIDPVPCVHCLAKFDPFFWKKHIRDVHGKKKTAPSANQPVTAKQRVPNSTKSAIFVGSIRASKKKKKKHKRGSGRLNTQQSGHAQTNNTDAVRASLQNERQERLLDRTKDYGFPSRENGRYGSHPSHDGFDDESKP
jgi:hypothetical protein